MAIIKQRDTRTGITYAYETTYVWDKEKKQSRKKSKIIGKIDPNTNEIVPTRGRKQPLETAQSRPPVKHQYYGATYLLDQLSETLGLTKDLKACFPMQYKQLLSIVYYMILEDNTPLYRFEKWHITHKHPYGEDITSPRSSDLFASISDDQIQHFFKLQGKRRIDEEYWAYDSTSISSYSETLHQVQYGHNKESDPLAQLNLLLVFGEKSKLPFYYRKLAGNIPDAKTVKHLLSELDILDFGKTKFVMDKGFYSKENINHFYREHIKFLLGARLSLSFIKTNLEACYNHIRMPCNYHECGNIYGYTVTSQWDYTQERPYKKDILKEKRRMYIHYFYDIERGANEEIAFDKKIAILYRELSSGQKNRRHENAYALYFHIKETPKKGVQVTYNTAAIMTAKRYLGYFSLITNEKMDAFTALRLYRMKDVVEKSFGNIKERLNMRRLLVSSEKSLDGKLFVQFIALILISYLDRKMHDSKLYEKYTMHQLIDKLDVIECFETPNHQLRIGEILQKQIDIFHALDVLVP